MTNHPEFEEADIKTLFEIWQANIPLVNAMQIAFEPNSTDHSWSLTAPLPPNQNHMGTAFGGSIAVLATLTGWAQTWLLTPRALNVDIVVASSQIEYCEPGISDLSARAIVPCDKTIAFYLKCLERKNRGSIHIETQVNSANQAIANFSAKYVVSLKAS